MIIFRTSKPLTYDVFVDELISFINILLLLVFSLSLFFPEKAKDQTFFILLFILVKTTELLQKRILVEIGYDTEKKYLHFYSKGYFTKLKKMKTPFDNMFVEKDKKFPSKKTFFRAKIYTLYVKKDKKEVFKVDMKEDGFTEQTLDAIVSQFEQIGVPVM